MHPHPPRPQPPRQPLHFLWALMPAYTCGLLGFVPSLHAALKRGGGRRWGVAVGYLVVQVLLYVLVGVVESDTNASAMVGLGLIGYAGLATVHAFKLRHEVFTPSPPPPPPPAADPAVARAMAMRQRREQARALAAGDPGLARDLRIGRPDLVPREYDDGGLVDINHVPADGLAAMLGLSLEHAAEVVEVRDRVGPFSGPDDLTALTTIPPHQVDKVRDRIITL